MQRLSVLASGVIVLVTLLLPVAVTVSAQTDGITVATGLNGPQGVLVAPDGSVWVAEAGTGGPNTVTITNSATGETEVARLGDTARVLKVAPDGQQTEVAWLPSLARPTAIQGASRLELLDGDIYVTLGWWNADGGPTPPQSNMATVSRIQDNRAIPVASTWDFEAANNPDGFERDSHPYGILAGADGTLWVADAGANAILKVDTRSGQVGLAVPLADLSAAQPNPARGSLARTAPVPTGIALGTDGDVYVALLPGFPFEPGSAKVVHIGHDGSVADFATGLSMLTDLRLGPDGNLYAVSFGEFNEPSGMLIRIKGGTASEVILDGLAFPTSVDFSPTGDAYIALNGIGEPGSGRVVVFPRATSRTGRPLPPPMVPPSATEAAPTPRATEAWATEAAPTPQATQAWATEAAPTPRATEEVDDDTRREDRREDRQDDRRDGRSDDD